jgi:hypothetical protein
MKFHHHHHTPMHDGDFKDQQLGIIDPTSTIVHPLHDVAFVEGW